VAREGQAMSREGEPAPLPAPQSAVVVAVASDAIEAAIWRDALHDAGIPAAVYERGVGAALGGANTFGASYPLLVDRGQVAAARNVIADLGGAVALAPVHDERAVRYASYSAGSSATAGVRCGTRPAIEPCHPTAPASTVAQS
jgi:hypothetical protein